MNKKTWIGFVTLAIMLPFAVNFALQYWPINSAPGIDISSWLSFWGSYLGGLLGSFAALLAIFESRRQMKQQQEENNKNRRLSLQPLLDIRDRFYTEFKSKSDVKSTESSNSTKNVDIQKYLLFDVDELSEVDQPTFSRVYHRFLDHNQCKGDLVPKKMVPRYLDISNFGLAPALHVTLSIDNDKKYQPIDLGSFKQGYSKHYAILFLLHGGSSFDLTVTFSDVLGNVYTQKQVVTYDICDLTLLPTEIPVLMPKSSFC